MKTLQMAHLNRFILLCTCSIFRQYNLILSVAEWTQVWACDWINCKSITFFSLLFTFILDLRLGWLGNDFFHLINSNATNSFTSYLSFIEWNFRADVYLSKSFTWSTIFLGVIKTCSDMIVFYSDEKVNSVN